MPGPMTDPFLPGAARAGVLLSPAALVDAMVVVEEAWAQVGLSPVAPEELDDESAGNPVPSLVAVLRERTGDASLHRGLTSQDVLDTAMLLCLRDSIDRVRSDLALAGRHLVALAAEHRETAAVARTITQHAVPTTFGLRAAGWLTGLLEAYDELGALDLPIQLGGAAGTSAALVELGLDPATERTRMAATLGLSTSLPWHTRRRPITRIADVLVATTDACGHLARDVLVATRPEVGELSEGRPGGSSTMPRKQNPVLATLVQAAALATPALAATLHLAAAQQVDERADGAWHAEWDTLRSLGRRTVIATSQTADLVAGLVVHPDRMAATLLSAHDGVRAEQRAMAEHAGHQPAGDYLGDALDQVDAVLARAAATLPEPPA